MHEEFITLYIRCIGEEFFRGDKEGSDLEYLAEVHRTRDGGSVVDGVNGEVGGGGD